MKQVQFATYGGPDVLVYTDVPDPTPGPGEVLIKVEAAGVNFSDLMRRSDTYVVRSPLPYVLGVEVAGSIEAVGPDVDHLTTGTPVLGILSNGGGYSQYAVASVNEVIPLPPGIGAGESTALVVQGLTAYLSLASVATLGQDKSVLIHAAAGGVGTIAIQVAKLLGAYPVIGAASTEEKLSAARALGADLAINYKDDDDWPRQVLAATHGRGADVILDSIGGTVFTQSLTALAPFGQLISIGAASGTPPQLDVMSLYRADHVVAGFLLSNWFRHGNAVSEALQQLITWVAEGKLNIPAPTAFSLAQAADAHSAIHRRTTTGKVILTPWS